MTDIVERLRACVPCDEYDHVKCDAIFTEAADEIERLTEALRDILRMNGTKDLTDAWATARAALNIHPTGKRDD